MNQFANGWLTASISGRSSQYWPILVGVSIASSGSTAAAGSGASISQLVGQNANPTAVAADGNFVAGQIGSGLYKAVRWSSPGSFLELPDPPPYVSGAGASAVSDDGTVLVGWAGSSTYGPVAVRWTIDGAQVLWGNGDAAAVSADGLVAVGTRDIDPFGPVVSRAMAWSAASGAVELPMPVGYLHATALDVSANGQRILGELASASDAVPIIWDASGGYVLLPSISGATRVSGLCISGDGALVGVSVSTPGQFSGALWNAAKGYQPISTSHNFQPLDIDHDGSVVVGNDGGINAVRWSVVSGARPLRDFLVDAGADLTGWSALTSATGVSPDGRWITGRGVLNGQQTGFLAFAPLECVGDILADRVINGADLGSLLAYWGPVTASPISRGCDLNGDNVVNGADIGLLLAGWGNCP